LKFLVNLKDLKKINHKEVPYSSLMWMYRVPDKEMVWKDEKSGEIFILDASGIWSKSGISHPLIS